MLGNCLVVEDGEMVKGYGRVGRVVGECGVVNDDGVIGDSGVERDGRIIGNNRVV